MNSSRQVHLMTLGEQLNVWLLIDDANSGGKQFSEIIPLKGPILRVWKEDLDEDGASEIYILFNQFKTNIAQLIIREELPTGLRRINFPSQIESDNTPAYEGFRGRDEIIQSGKAILRRFPVFKPQDPEGMPSNGWRELTYTLENKGFELRGQQDVQ